MSSFNKAQIKQEFDRDGFAVLSGFLSRNEADEISTRIGCFIREALPCLDHAEAMYEDVNRPESIKQIPRLAAHDTYFDDLLRSDRLVQLAELLLEDQAKPMNLQWFDKVPQLGKPTPPHQDGFYFMIEPNEAVTMWLALDEVDDANGCVRYVRGSHRTGLRPHGRTDVVGFSQAISDYGAHDRQQEVAIHANRGDLLVHHALTIHTAGGNKTRDRHRRALGFVYHAGRAQHDQQRFEAYQQLLKRELTDQGKL